jgi:DNA-binding transcriptional LysR family regulator
LTEPLYDQAEVDAAWVLRPDDRRKQGKAVYAESFSWFGAVESLPVLPEPLPLATHGKVCRIRKAATRALDDADIAWEEVFVGKGAAILGAAAAAGLAIAVLAKRTAPSGTIDVSRVLALPLIPAQEVMLYCALNDRRSREVMRIMALAFQP